MDLLVKPQVFLYKIQTGQTEYEAASWNLNYPDWVYKLRIVSQGRNCVFLFEEADSNNFILNYNVDSYPGSQIEPVSDSSRFFVLKSLNCDGSKIGMGFTERSDSADFKNVLKNYFTSIGPFDKISNPKNEGRI